jgi:hypothetical protein
MKFPKDYTMTFKILEFIGASRTGVRNVDVEKFIVQLQGKVWDPKIGVGMWTSSLYDGRYRPGIYTRFCAQRDKLKFLDEKTAHYINNHYLNTGSNKRVYHLNPNAAVRVIQPAISSKPLDNFATAEFPSDEIKDNSTIVSRTIVPINANKPSGLTPLQEAIVAFEMAKQECSELAIKAAVATNEFRLASARHDSAARKVADLLGL